MTFHVFIGVLLMLCCKVHPQSRCNHCKKWHKKYLPMIYGGCKRCKVRLFRLELLEIMFGTILSVMAISFSVPWFVYLIGAVLFVVIMPPSLVDTLQ